MATAKSAVWRIRIGGNALNGAGYDSTTYPGGTDYSQQDSPILSLTDLACSNNTTLTSATGGFTAAMVGNAMWIPAAGGATAGYYWISAYTDTNTVTLDRTPGTVSSGSGKVGGAASGIADLYNKVVAGNTVYIKPSALNALTYPTTGLDYTLSSGYTATSGAYGSGLVKWIGDGGMPTIGTQGFGLGGIGQRMENLYFVALSNGSPSSGVISPDSSSVVNNCIINLNNNVRYGIVAGYTTTIMNTEINGIGAVTGSTAPPSYSVNGYGIYINGDSVSILNSSIHHCASDGINDFSWYLAIVVMNCKIWKNAGNGINYLIGGSSNGIDLIIGCTIDANMKSGILMSAGGGALWSIIVFNNSITNHTQSSMFGIKILNGTLAVNNSEKHFLDYNNLYNNTTNISSNVSVDPNSISIDPGYSSASTGEFTPSNSAMQVGFP